MPRHVRFRLLFVIAVALAAAAIGDALVESVSNAGIVGRGYSDTNHLSVIPTLLAGASIALVLIGIRCVELLRRAGKPGDWLLDMAVDISAGSPLADLPWVLVLQFTSLFAMESIEQVLLGGTLLGGLVWLGGPIWFSVVMHVLIGTACTVIVARFMRSIVAHCACLISDALELLLEVFSRQSAGIFAHRRNEREPFHAAPVRVHQIGERAPPLLATLT